MLKVLSVISMLSGSRYDKVERFSEVSSEAFHSIRLQINLCVVVLARSL